MKPRVLMFGWEFPPFNTGGLGTACHGLTKGLVQEGAHVIFVLPKGPKTLKQKSHVDIVIADHLVFGNDVVVEQIPSLLSGYVTPENYEKIYHEVHGLKENDADAQGPVYGKNLFEEVSRYAQQARIIAQHYLGNYDVIHAHDWMAYQAGMIAKEVSGKPLVVHMHATEFDRTGGHPNQYIYEIEKKGMEAADNVICVSNYTKQMVMKHYGIPEEKITVVHNAVEFSEDEIEAPQLKNTDKIVLFLGRVTIQKGPDWFLYAAQKVLEHEPEAKFVIAGSGDMMPFIIEKAAEMGIHKNVLFTGFLRGKDIDRAYKMAAVYVMPSISEPFGITPLEAMRNGTPVIISKQSGVSEVVNHALKVDFWDINEMANKILGVLRYQPLRQELSYQSTQEVRKFNWREPAQKCLAVYQQVLQQSSVGN